MKTLKNFQNKEYSNFEIVLLFQSAKNINETAAHATL